MSAPLVSVVPDYDCGRFLRDAVDRVLRPSYAAREIIVVDDGSTDDSLACSSRRCPPADWDMWRRIACDDEIDVVREPLMLYRLRPASMHRQIEVFERDMLHGFERMFADQAAAAERPLPRRRWRRLRGEVAGAPKLSPGNGGASS